MIAIPAMGFRNCLCSVAGLIPLHLLLAVLRSAFAGGLLDESFGTVQ